MLLIDVVDVLTSWVQVYEVAMRLHSTACLEKSKFPLERRSVLEEIFQKPQGMPQINTLTVSLRQIQGKRCNVNQQHWLARQAPVIA